jgi:hypothetical protein
LGWYEEFHVLCAITPLGLITGFGFGSASTHDHRLLETFLAARAFPQAGLESVGSTLEQTSIADKALREHEPTSDGITTMVQW